MLIHLYEIEYENVYFHDLELNLPAENTIQDFQCRWYFGNNCVETAIDVQWTLKFSLISQSIWNHLRSVFVFISKFDDLELEGASYNSITLC